MPYAEVDYDFADDGQFKGNLTSAELAPNSADPGMTSTDQRRRASMVRNSVSLSVGDPAITAVNQLVKGNAVNANSADPSDIYADVEVMRRRKMTPASSDDHDKEGVADGSSPASDDSCSELDRVRLQSVSSNNRNNLLQRRLHTKKVVTIDETPQVDLKSARNGSLNECHRCHQGFAIDEEMVNSQGQIWHLDCFVCVQCFQAFPEGVFYEFDGRKYCEHDFNVLFAPCCNKCGEFIIGRVIKAQHASWHPECFLCELCDVQLSECGFINNASRSLCKDCNARERASMINKYTCAKCKSIIEDNVLKFKGDVYHSYHFNCENCKVELNCSAREKFGSLYCLRCFDKMGIPICGACRRPIEDRVVHALGKTWHPEHFVCAKCEKSFSGSRHFEKKGLAYCETHYHQLFGNVCYKCNTIISSDVFRALNKDFCDNHFSCAMCDRTINKKTKFYDFDLKPTCKSCFDNFPLELKKRLKKAHDKIHKKQ